MSLRSVSWTSKRVASTLTGAAACCAYTSSPVRTPSVRPACWLGAEPFQGTLFTPNRVGFVRTGTRRLSHRAFGALTPRWRDRPWWARHFGFPSDDVCGVMALSQSTQADLDRDGGC